MGKGSLFDLNLEINWGMWDVRSRYHTVRERQLHHLFKANMVTGFGLAFINVKFYKKKNGFQNSIKFMFLFISSHFYFLIKTLLFFLIFKHSKLKVCETLFQPFFFRYQLIFYVNNDTNSMMAILGKCVFCFSFSFSFIKLEILTFDGFKLSI